METRAYGKDRADGRWVREGEAWYRSLVERVPAVLYVDASDETSTTLYMSPQTDSMLGYSRGEWLEDPRLWVKILHPEDSERVLAEAARAQKTGEPFSTEYRFVAKDGRVVWVRDEAMLVLDQDGRPEYWQGVLLDITDRKEAEGALRKSEERFRLVARATGEAIWDNDLLTGEQEWDGATEALFGYPSPHRGVTAAWWEERMHPDDRNRVLRSLEALYEGTGEVWEEAYRFRKADGTYAEVEDRGYVVRDGSGKPVRMVGSMRDVTERKRQEEELKRSEELFRFTFEQADVGMAHVALDGRWIRVNDKLCEISGYAREELLGMTYLDLTLPKDVEASRDRVCRMLRGELGPYTVERRFVKKDGSRVWVSLSVSLVRKTSTEPNYLVCVADEITGLKLEEFLEAPLTPRELEILGQVVANRTDPQIS